MSLLHKSISALGENQALAVMKPCGQGCATDILALCEKILGRKVGSLEDLVAGWNTIREERGLAGKWEFEAGAVKGTFKECGCPLVRSGLVELHPVQCYCSQGMMETIFTAAAGKPASVELRRTIGRGDDVCHFVVTW